jgi:hypothetical protein
MLNDPTGSQARCWEFNYSARDFCPQCCLLHIKTCRWEKVYGIIWCTTYSSHWFHHCVLWLKKYKDYRWTDELTWVFYILRQKTVSSHKCDHSCLLASVSGVYVVNQRKVQSCPLQQKEQIKERRWHERRRQGGHNEEINSIKTSYIGGKNPLRPGPPKPFWFVHRRWANKK